MEGGESMLIETAYREHSGKMIQAMIRFSRDETAARDAVSQAFTQALVNRALLEAMPEPAVRAWLYSAARNALLDLKRREARATAVAKVPETEYLEPDPTDRLLVESLMNRLTPELRTPIYLKYYRGLTSGEIGSAMGIPAATVRTRIRTALGLMRGMAGNEDER